MTESTPKRRGRKPADTSDDAQKRQRPPHHEGHTSAQHTVLDEIEQRAQKRIAGGDRVALKANKKLDWNDIEPGYNYQWATDSETYPVNLQQMCDAGYTFVRHKHGQLAGTPVVMNSKGCNLYLMRCPEKYFLEDQKRVHEKSVRQYKEITQVGDREYAGDSKEMGEGKPVKMELSDTPESLRLMEGDN